MTLLPDGWRLVRLGDVADTSLGKMLDAARPKGSTRVPYLRNVNVQWGRIGTDDVREVELSAGELKRYELETGDLLVCEGGEIGRAAIWRGGSGYMAYQKALHRIRSNGEIDLSYLRYLLEYYADTGELASRATGTTILHLPQRMLRELPVPLPQPTEQVAIVEQLELHLSRLDAALALIRVVDRKISAFCNSYRSSIFASVAADLKGAVRPLLDVATICNGQTPRDLQLHSLERDGADSDTVPFYKIGDMNSSAGRWMGATRTYLAPSSVSKLGLTVRRPGTLLIPKRGGAIATNKKRILAEPACYDLNTMGLQPSSQLYPEYLWHWIQGVDLARLADGSNVPQINAPQIRGLSLPVPSIDVQVAISMELDDVEMKAQRLSKDLPDRRATTLRRALLQLAFEGRLVRHRTAAVNPIEGLANV